MEPGIEKMLAAKAATAARRATQDLRVRELKITRLTPTQSERLDRMFLEAKWLRNSIIAEGIFDYKLSQHGVHVKLPNGQLETRQLTILPAHVKQTIQQTLQANVKSLASAKKAGRLAGAIRFTDRVNSLEFKTGDVKIESSRAFIPKLGRVRVAGARQLGEEIANVRLVRRATGYYLLVASLTAKPEIQELPEGEPIGLDFGIKTHITTSEGTEWNLSIREPERLKRLQRKLQRQVKGSKNRDKTLAQLNRSYERLSNLKEEAANQFVASLKNRSLVALQDENLRGWKARRGYGRVIQHSAMGRVKSKLRRLPQAVLVERFAPTTQLCPECGSLNKLPLSQRVYSCECGYSMPRDLHAARNVLRMAQLSIFTPGEPGKAPAEGKVSTSREGNTSREASHASVKQETVLQKRSPETVSSSVAP